VRHLEGLDKTYVATVELGVETDTLDPEGRVVSTAPLPEEGSITAALPAFRGAVRQVPPAFSAVHVGGGRAYEVARAGGTPELREREVHVAELTVLRYNPPRLELLVRCSRGTYVRSLARDLARAAGSCAHLSALRRTAVGDIGVEEACRPEDFRPERHLEPAGAFLSRHAVLPTVVVGGLHLSALRHGRAVDARELPEECPRSGEVACLDSSGRLLAVARVSDTSLRVTTGFGPGFGPGR
jgi:tRNA pseudouridine55 synthase